MKIDYVNALKRVDGAQGAWVLHGAEPLLEQNLLDAFRRSWQQREIERQRIDLGNISDWKLVFNALNSLSLFAQQLAIEVHGNIKPDAATLKQLKHFLQHDEQNLLLLVMPKQDSASLKSAFFQLVEANGVVVPLQANTLSEQKRILAIEAEQLGVQLDGDAWHMLLQQHEHHLLAAKNSLTRLRDTFPELSVLGAPELLSCLQDQSRYSSFDWSDALLKGDWPQAIKMLQFLLSSGEASSLLLWTLSKEMRLLMQLYEQPQQAMSLGIWKTKIPLYQQALRRLKPQQFLAWPSLLLRIDAAIKGMSLENPEHLLQQAVAELCGQRLFT